MAREFGATSKAKAKRRASGLRRRAAVDAPFRKYPGGSADHGRGGADQPRRPATGGGDPGGERRYRSDRESGAIRRRESASESLSIEPSRCRRCWPKPACRRSELSVGVARSLETTRRSLALIAGLEGVSRSVDKIVDGIAMVSIQTNMLAVSGSVEAARAGESRQGICRRLEGHPQSWRATPAKMPAASRIPSGPSRIRSAAVRRELEADRSRLPRRKIKRTPRVSWPASAWSKRT